MREWHDAVFARDANACVVCGRKVHQTKLVAHHVIPRSHSKALQTDPRNGVTLCQQAGCFAHEHAHHRGGDLYLWWDGQQIRFTRDKDAFPAERERLALLKLC